VDVTGGVYSTLLGTANPLTASFSEVYYLGITLPGGPELVPRSRLVSAPYALSLIGQSNTFPSSGAVGAGTVTPDAEVELHVKDVEASAKLLVESTADDAVMEIRAGEGVPEILINSTNTDYNPKLTLKRGTVTGTMTMDGDALSLKTTHPSVQVRFDSNYAGPINPPFVALNVLNNGAIGFGNPDLVTTDTFKFKVDNIFRFIIDENAVRVASKPLIVSGFASRAFNYALYRYTVGSNNYTASPITIAYSLEAVSNIITPNLYINSDQRIKKDISTSNSRDDLSELLRLRVADYRMKDEVTHGGKIHKGFIAQEVAQVSPDAVGMVAAVVPDIYSLSKGIDLNGQELTISLDSKHGLKVGDQVKLISEKDISGSLFEVISIHEENSFTVNGWTAGPVDDVFVYGREVDDFHNINYDYIYSLNVSATQELARRLFDLEKDNESLRSEVKGIDERLLKLETLVTGSAQR
jgi:hypothetical protein